MSFIQKKTIQLQQRIINSSEIEFKEVISTTYHAVQVILLDAKIHRLVRKINKHQDSIRDMKFVIDFREDMKNL